MKKRFSLLLAAVLITSILSACSEPAESQAASESAPDTSSESGSASSDVAEQGASSETSPEEDVESDLPTVYITTDISAEGLLNIYSALEENPIEDADNVAIKINIGDSAENYTLTHELIAPLVQSTRGTLVDTSSIYGVNRADSTQAMLLADELGYFAVSPVDIMDLNGSTSLTVDGGKYIAENLVGSSFANYDSYIVLSHFTGHPVTGISGAIENTGMGLATRSGQAIIQTLGTAVSGSYEELVANEMAAPTADVIKAMTEAAKSVSDELDGKIVYINVLNNLSVNSDSFPEQSEPSMEDIGILLSTDPVALDAASVEVIRNAEDGADFIAQMESLAGIIAVEYGEEILLGSSEYNLELID